MLARYAIENGGSLIPLRLPKHLNKGLGLTNPSIYNDNGILRINLREVNYALYHCHNFFQTYGPLQYIHPENDKTLKTINYVGILGSITGSNYGFTDVRIINTSNLDIAPKWDFIGLEDARLVKWDNKFYLIGVRRDHTTTGQGRMELSEIDINTGVELSRRMIPTIDPNSYCEKNWMPILDNPFTFVKWTNPTEIVQYDLASNKTSQISLGNYKPTCAYFDLRGGSQVIPFLQSYYLAVVHTSANFQSELGQKDAIYRHHFVLWDKDFNLLHVSNQFSFTDAKIEFCAGICDYDNDFVLTFGRQDSSAFALRINKNSLKEYIWKT